MSWYLSEVLLSTSGSDEGTAIAERRVCPWAGRETKPFSQGSHLGSSIQAELETKSRGAVYPHPGVRETFASLLATLGNSLLASLTLSPEQSSLSLMDKNDKKIPTKPNSFHERISK